VGGCSGSACASNRRRFPFRNWRCIRLLVVSVLGFEIFRRAKTTVNPLKPEEASSLVTGGVYRYTRNHVRRPRGHTRGWLAATYQVMNSIYNSVPDSIDKLNKVNSLLTNGEACSGRQHGEPIPHGSETAQLSTAVMNTADFCKPCRKSAARCACDAALNIARLSFFNTLIHDAI
jgi:hypothetical protein